MYILDYYGHSLDYIHQGWITNLRGKELTQGYFRGWKLFCASVINWRFIS